MPINNPNLTTSGIVGTDGITPVYDPTARWCWWNITEIYIGNAGAKRYVPKVNDMVMDSDLYIVYLVVGIDPTTLIATLVEVKPNNQSNNLSTNDILFGVGPGTQADTYRVYLDSSVTPHILAVDARLKVAGTMCSYAKIFRGADVSSLTGKVISRLYDQAGTLLSQNIPLELAAVDSHVNHSIKVVSVCYTGETLIDGELVTVVFYNDAGHVVSKRQLLVENTSFIRSVNAGQKYVSHISLDTPFMSPTGDGLIEFPLNIPIQALNLMGIVHYSDGTTLKMPVDGTKFRLYGMDQYVSTIVGQKIELVLSYALSSDEIVYGAVTSDGKYVTAPYNIVTTSTDGSYMVKLFGYPVWQNGINGYRMSWFLYNLDRNIKFDVTQYVTFGANSSAFDPLAYGLLQRLVVNINLKNVSGAFKAYIHTQTIDIVLKQPGGDPRTNWLVGFESSTSKPLFGEGLSARINGNDINISSGIATFNEWKERLYNQTYPVFDSSIEINAPTPNFFALVYESYRFEFPIENWSNDLTVGNTPEVNKTMYVEFFKRTPNTDIQLSIAGLTVR